MSGIAVTLASRWRMARRLVRAHLPEAITARTGPQTARYRPQDVPAPVEPPPTEVRLLVGPRNFAGQGDRWARAAERLPGVGAVSMIAGDNGGLDFPVDYRVPDAVYTNSRRWGTRQREAVAAGFTHVMIEAVSSMFGAASDKVVGREVEWLRARGVQVGMLCHGTDIRLPDRHAQLDEWSPFRDAPDEWVSRLQARADFNQRVLDRVGGPVFVSTPEMLLDRPGAQWLPIVVDVDRWSTSSEILRGDRPVVLHAPTNPLVKGTALIEPIVQSMHEAGAIDYRRVIRVPSHLMPALYGDADVVLEQFALGMYSVTSVEAMAAGRIAVAHVHAQVRDHVRRTTGLELPVVEATPETLRDVLDDIRARPEHYRQVAQRGPVFVRAVHDGRLSAQTLAPFLGVSS